MATLRLTEEQRAWGARQSKRLADHCARKAEKEKLPKEKDSTYRLAIEVEQKLLKASRMEAGKNGAPAKVLVPADRRMLRLLQAICARSRDTVLTGTIPGYMRKADKEETAEGQRYYLKYRDAIKNKLDNVIVPLLKEVEGNL